MKMIPLLDASTARETTKASLPIKVCMHVLGTAATDPRVLREATALVEAGYTVSIVDIEEKENHQSEEDIRGVHLKHVMVARSFFSTRFDTSTLVRVATLFVRTTFRLLADSSRHLSRP